MRTICYWTHG